MKLLILTIILTFTFVAKSQMIQNGGFEDGPNVTFFSQITKANFWLNGCEFNADLYDCQAQPVPSGPFAGQIPMLTPVGCLYPRINGTNNCRFAALRTEGFNSGGSSYLSAGHIRNELTSNLLPNVNYEIQFWVARKNEINIPPTRRIEAVLRATTDGNICDNSIVIPIQTDIPVTNCEWMFISTTFQLSDVQALGGWDWIEFRELSRPGYNQERIYFDDVSLLGGINDLGTDELSYVLNESIKIYPNPTTSILNIETNSTFQKVFISDLMGKKIFETTDTKSIELDFLTKGVYIIHFENGNQIYFQKFVKE